MNKYLILSILSFSISISNGQSLRDQLWDFVSECHNSILEGYELSYDTSPTELSEYCQNCIDDTANGYLYIEGAWPACGCSCDIKVGAYRGSSDQYTLLKYESWPCSNSFGIYSNKNLEKVMPFGFSLNSFNDQASADSISYFHLVMEIPRIGTDTKVKIQLYPLGQCGRDNNGLSFNTDNSNVLFNPYALLNIIEEIETESQLNLILNKKISELPIKLQKEIESNIYENGTIESLSDLSFQLQYTYKVYLEYSSLKFKEMVLSWSRNTERFEVKSKSGKPENITFFEFLKSANYFSPLC